MNNLYVIRQNVNNDWDTYDSAVVVAKTEEEARTIHPDGNRWIDGKWEGWSSTNTWCNPEEVEAELIGTTTTAASGTVVVSSFNAG